MRFSKIAKGVIEITEEFTHQMTLETLKSDKAKLKQEIENLKERIDKIDEMIEALKEVEE
jgi:cell division protein FtsB